MSGTVSPNQSDIQTSLRTFLLSILPAGTEVIEAQINRVAEPPGTDFVVMTWIDSERLETNVDTSGDVAFIGSISNTVLTVTQMLLGSITPGATLFGPSIAAGSTIGPQLSGTTGGIGTYSVTPSQTSPSQKMACGVWNFLQPSKVHIQLDVHGPNSADNSKIITTIFRDDFAVQAFKSYGQDVVPLYQDTPKQVPFINDQNQYENRWVIDTFLQANQQVSLPQQYADQLKVGIINVDASYPP